MAMPSPYQFNNYIGNPSDNSEDRFFNGKSSTHKLSRLIGCCGLLHSAYNRLHLLLCHRQFLIHLCQVRLWQCHAILNSRYLFYIRQCLNILLQFIVIGSLSCNKRLCRNINSCNLSSGINTANASIGLIRELCTTQLNDAE